MPKEKQSAKTTTTTTTKRTGASVKRTKSKSRSAADGTAELNVQENRSELLAKIDAVEHEVVKANERRNYMQLERDKIDGFWEITKNELRVVEHKLRDAQRDLEVAEEQHSMELRLQTQKLKQVKHEHLEQENNLRTESEKLSSKIRHDCRTKIELVQSELEQKEQEVRDALRSLVDSERKLKLEKAADIEVIRDEIRHEAEGHVSAVELETIEAMATFKTRVEEQIGETVSRYESYMSKLTDAHAKACAELKEYFNALTDSQAREIERLQHSSASMKERLTKCNTELSEVRHQNASLVAPLATSESQCKELCKKLSHSERRCRQLESELGSLREAQTQLKAERWRNEVLTQKLEQVQDEVETLTRSRFRRFWDEHKLSAVN